MLLTKGCNIKVPIFLTLLPLPMGVSIYLILARMMRIEPEEKQQNSGNDDDTINVLLGLAYFVLSFLLALMLTGLFPLSLRMYQLCEYYGGSNTWLIAGFMSIIFTGAFLFQFALHPIGDDFFFESSSSSKNKSPSPSPSALKIEISSEKTDEQEDNKDDDTEEVTDEPEKVEDDDDNPGSDTDTIS